MPKVKRKTKREKIKRYKTRKNIKYKTKNNKYKTRKRKKTMKGGAQTPTIEQISSDLGDLRNKIKESTTSEETFVKLMEWAEKSSSLSETTDVSALEPALEPEPVASDDENTRLLGSLKCNFNFLWMTCSVFSGSLGGINDFNRDGKCAVCKRTQEQHTTRFDSSNLNKCLADLNTNWVNGVTENIKLHFWYDSRYDTPPTVEHPGITLHNLADLPNYTDFTIAGLYYKVDYAKLVILLSQMQDSDSDYSCSLDIDMNIQKVLSANVINIEALGYVMNYGRGVKVYENQFIMVKNNVSNVSLALETLIIHINKKYKSLSKKHKPERLRPEHQGIFDCHNNIYYILYSLKRLAQRGVELDWTGDKQLMKILSSSLTIWDNHNISSYGCLPTKKLNPKTYQLYKKKEFYSKATPNGQQLFDELVTKGKDSYRDLKIYEDITPYSQKLLEEEILGKEYNSGKKLNLGELKRPFSIDDFVNYLDGEGIKRGDEEDWDDPLFDFNDEFIFLTVNVGVYESRFDRFD